MYIFVFLLVKLKIHLIHKRNEHFHLDNIAVLVMLKMFHHTEQLKLFQAFAGQVNGIIRDVKME